MYEHLIEYSGFELSQTMTARLDLANSTLTIFTTALFAYLILCHIALDRLSKGQLIVVTTLYSFFMLGQIGLLANHYANIAQIQDYVSTLYSNVLPSNAFYFFTPSIALVSWIISIFYMWSARRRNDT